MDQSDIVTDFACKEFYRQMYGIKVSDLEWIENVRKSFDGTCLNVTVCKVDSPAKRYFKVTLNVEEEPF